MNQYLVAKSEGSLLQAAGTDILIINGGSSSIKFAVYRTGKALERKCYGTVDRLGASGSTLTIHYPAEPRRGNISFVAGDHEAAANSLLDWLTAEGILAGVGAIGHRIVHGMQRIEPARLTRELLDELHGIEHYDPDHLPGELILINTFRRRYPQLPQVACFDTAFHSTMPRVAKMLAIPRRYQTDGVQRYGFHGLSYAFLIEELARIAGANAAAGRVILAHLGNGASMAAVKGGKSIDTSMGFTPASGLLMSTRSGDLDPGLSRYFARTEQMTAQRFDDMVNHRSGLLGISETGSDMRDLLALEAEDIRAAEAVALFCYQAKKCVGAYAAALGGLDTLVFAGGIGENAAPVRARICDDLDFLGVALDASRNAAHAPVISTDASRVTVRVIPTDEELMIAKSVCRILDPDAK
ncbi:MAG: acetate/propionate family kinase [Burkholderiales bacterium]